jgi:four helix bundle protein
MTNNNKIKSFTDLLVWQEGHKLAVLVYQITRKFPREEMYSLSDQMRRASVSVTSNIAEGFGRQGYKEKVQFYYISHGSLTELENQVLIAKDVGYLTVDDFKKIMEQANKTHTFLIGFIKKSKTFIIHKSLNP